MVVLNNVLGTFGYTTPEQQQYFVKFAAYRGCFGQRFNGRFISDDEADLLLSKRFISAEAGIEWITSALTRISIGFPFHIFGSGANYDFDSNTFIDPEEDELPYSDNQLNINRR